MNGQILSLTYLAVAASSGAAVATAPKGPPPPPVQQVAAPEFPAMRFDEKGIGLLDAVRTTLQNDPAIKLSLVAVDNALGVVQQQVGLFDLTLNGNGQYQRNQSELLDSTKASEADKRQQLQNAIDKATPLRNSFSAVLANLQSQGPLLTTNPAAANLTQGITDPDTLNEMTLLQQELILNQQLLAQATNPVLRQDFLNLQNTTINTAISRFTALFNQVDGIPAAAQSQLAALGAVPTEGWQQTINGNANLSKELRSGIVLQPYANINYQSANYVGKSDWQSSVGGEGVAPNYTAQIGFEVTVPLRRGLGRDDTGAPEAAARQDAEAKRLLATFTKSESVLSTIQAYWTVRADVEQVEVLERSVQLQKGLLDVTHQLIQAKDKPRSDEARVQASTSSALAQLEGAKGQLAADRVALARVMGISLVDPSLSPLPADSFPTPPASWSPTDEGIAQLARESPARRFDYRAALEVEREGRTLVRGAELETRRVVNLDAKTWTTNVWEASPAYGPLNPPPTYSIPAHGPFAFGSGSASLTIMVPFGNNQQRGLLAQQQANLRQASISAADLQRTTALDVARDAQSLRLLAEQVARAKEAVAHYDQTIEDERYKMKAGDATLLDTILTEQQTTAARLAYVAAQQGYAQTLAQLRFDAGLLVLEAQGKATITEGFLRSVPAPLSGDARK
jgi:outer membrane protein TolC